MIIAMCEELQLIHFTAKAAQIQVLQWCQTMTAMFIKCRTKEDKIVKYLIAIWG